MSGAPGGPPSAMRIEDLVQKLDLSDDQKLLLRSRWLDQMRWMSAKARVSRRRHLALRWVITCGGVILPALVSFSLGAGQSEPVRWITFGVSLVVALLAVTEEVFHFGDTWHHYRRTAELLKTAGWQFVQLTGTYSRTHTHADALPAFTRHVEEILTENVDEYFGRAVAESGKSGDKNIAG